MPSMTAIKTARVEFTGEAVEYERAILELALEVRVAGNVHHNVFEGRILDPTDHHRCAFQNCVVDGQLIGPQSVGLSSMRRT